MEPRTMPITLAIRKAVSILPPYSMMTTAMTYMATVATAVKEMSMPPEISTSSTPMASIPMKE